MNLLAPVGSASGDRVANDGKLGLCPCGHIGRAVIGQFYLRDICDAPAVPEPIEEDPTTVPLCLHCGSEDVKVYPGFTVTGKNLWHCFACMRSFSE